jgi:hypothetical protein|nr:MAG TPA: hypothetical protein [Caudoviricetes sp.]
MIGCLPTTLTVEGKEYQINTDFRNILVFLEACEDPEINDKERLYILLKRVYGTNYGEVSSSNIEEALEQAKWFVDCGKSDNEVQQRKVIDWVQDATIIFPAVNRVASKEVRAEKYLHWWTFMGYFMEIEGGTFSTVLAIRQKKMRGKKLEKWEQDFYSHNKNICDIKARYTEEEQAEIDYLNSLLN